MGAEEGILYADCNLEIGVQMKLRHDFAGHYNRPDIFHLQVNRAAPSLYSVHGVDQQAALAVGPMAQLGGEKARLDAPAEPDQSAEKPPSGE